MRCPNNEECEITFTTETWDQGDGVWFQSGFSYVYDDEQSYHVPDCNLTDEQINQLEKERNNDFSYDDFISEP